MRVGQNPAKSIDNVPQPHTITVALAVYIPFLKGYYAESLEVLKVCLNSIWENTSLPYDLLVFDNDSCSEVKEYLLDAHEKNLIQYLLLSDKNIGKGGAWNFIFQGAPGEIIAYTDSDVYFYPRWLNTSIEILDAFPNAGMVTSRPMRTPEKYFSSTLEWANEHPEVTVESGQFLSWNIDREHTLSLGVSEEQARKWYDSGLDWKLTRDGVSSHLGAAHFQFITKKSLIQQFLPLELDRPMGQVRLFDKLINEAGYLRLTTCEPLVKHLGNKVESYLSDQRKSDDHSNMKRFINNPIIKRSLLGIYNLIFRLYFKY
jgi:glycosyltransferase involved in cell wall biosynthesis